MSTVNKIAISGNAEDILHPQNDPEDVNKPTTTDPILAKLSKITCRQLQKEKDRLKQKKAANAYTTIFTCMLCVAMAVVIITKLLEDGDRTKFYDKISSQLPVKVHEKQKRPILTLSETKKLARLNYSVTEVSVGHENVIQTSESSFNATTQDFLNEIPKVEPLFIDSTEANSSNNNKACVLSYFLIVLLIFKF